MSTGDSTGDLVSRARSGDRAAFETLMDRFRPRLETLIRTRMGERARARVETDDILQETFIRAYQCIDRLEWRGEDPFCSWLGSIAEHLIWHASEAGARAPLHLEHEVAASETSPSKNLQRQERFDRFEEAIRRLPPDYRTVLVLARIEQLKIDEIARRMERSPNAVKKLLARALEALKRGFGSTESLNLPSRELKVEGTDHGE